MKNGFDVAVIGGGPGGMLPPLKRLSWEDQWFF